MNDGLNLDGILDGLAKRLANELRGELRQPAGQSVVRPRLLTVAEAATYLGRSKASVQHLISDGVLPVVRSDRRVFLDVEDLDLWISQHKEVESSRAP